MEDDALLKTVVDLVLEHGLVAGRCDPDVQRVVDFVPPQDLARRLGGLEIHPEPATGEEVRRTMEDVIRHSVKTAHPRFFNQLYHGVDACGLAGAWLSDALNTNNHTYEVAPAFVVVERALVKYVMEKFGWDPDRGDGITSPGGSLSNFYGMVLARYLLAPEYKTKGLFGSKPLVVFASDDSHYSTLKGAHWLGLGTENVVSVPTDRGGRMVPEALEGAVRKCLADGKVPMMVNATAGTTVCGAYDDLNLIADVCEKFSPKIWLHVDACWGGTAVLSKRWKHLLSGSERADSIAWNAHKMLGAPLQASLFICQHKNLLHKCNSAAAEYLFQQDKFYDVSYDTGDMSVQCGRKVDAFKTWFMLKSRGEDYFEDLVDNAFDQALYLADRIRSRPGFELVVDPVSCTNVCFVYVPPSLRSLPRDAAVLHRVPPAVKEALTRRGTLMVGYQPLKHKNLPNFFRMVVHCLPKSARSDMDFVLDEMERVGKDISFKI